MKDTVVLLLVLLVSIVLLAAIALVALTGLPVDVVYLVVAIGVVIALVIGVFLGRRINVKHSNGQGTSTTFQVNVDNLN